MGAALKQKQRFGWMRTLSKMKTGLSGQRLRMFLYIGASSSIGSSSALFPMCLLATDNEAIAETVSASSASRLRTSLKEQPSVEAERCSECQYLL